MLSLNFWYQAEQSIIIKNNFFQRESYSVKKLLPWSILFLGATILWAPPGPRPRTVGGPALCIKFEGRADKSEVGGILEFLAAKLNLEPKLSRKFWNSFWGFKLSPPPAAADDLGGVAATKSGRLGAEPDAEVEVGRGVSDFSEAVGPLKGG